MQGHSNTTVDLAALARSPSNRFRGVRTVLELYLNKIVSVNSGGAADLESLDRASFTDIPA